VDLRLVPTKIPKYQLFDLENDPGELENLIEAQRPLADGMIQRLQEAIE
jgi:hypothetical protein